MRVFFRVLFGSGYGETVLLDLPAVPAAGLGGGVTLLGPVTLESLLAGAYDGMRLATVIICVGAANSLADPRKLLASLPAALYEVGTAVVIAFSLFPQLAESVQRVRRARRLRGETGRGVRALRRIIVPVLEDALDRSVGAGREHGRPRLRPLGREEPGGPTGDRGLPAAGPARPRRRLLRLPRLVRAAGAGLADAGRRPPAGRPAASWPPDAVSRGPATARPGGWRPTSSLRSPAWSPPPS